MRFAFAAMLALVMGSAVQAAPAFAPDGVAVPLWPGKAPGSEAWSIPERTAPNPGGAALRSNISTPTLTVFRPRPDKAVGTAVILAPGGGFRTLPQVDPASVRFLTDRGVTAVVLTYRTMQDTPEEQAMRARLAGGLGKSISVDELNRDLAGPYMRPIREIAAADGRRAVELVRAHAVELGVRRDRIGLIGQSSGGVIAATVGVSFTDESRPDFIGVFYGAPPDRLIIPHDAPPAYIATADNDPMTWEGSAHLYLDWHRAGRPVELHVYGKGQHGLREPASTALRWRQDFLDWLSMNGLAEKAP